MKKKNSNYLPSKREGIKGRVSGAGDLISKLPTPSPYPLPMGEALIRYLLFIIVLFLGACASPTFQMTPAQVASLSDNEVCKYKNNYRDETKLEAEISRRNLNCDRFYRECLEQGNAPGTQAMGFCIATLRENERLRMEQHGSWYDDRAAIYSTIPRRPHH